ncbi:hypothetical protein JW859_07755 [bacterium]|nr:hypothetical protein [bacterium]
MGLLFGCADNSRRINELQQQLAAHEQALMRLQPDYDKYRFCCDELAGLTSQGNTLAGLCGSKPNWPAAIKAADELARTEPAAAAYMLRAQDTELWIDPPAGLTEEECQRLWAAVDNTGCFQFKHFLISADDDKCERQYSASEYISKLTSFATTANRQKACWWPTCGPQRCRVPTMRG